MEKPERLLATKLFLAGVAAADPAQAVLRALQTNLVGPAQGKLIVVAMGKAAPAMARAAMEQVQAASVTVVTTEQGAAPLDGATVLYGGHPLPDQNSDAAAQKVEQVISNLQSGDQVLAMISGGASALVCAPVEGIDLQDKIEVNRLLLGSGLDIGAMNLVRQNLSRLKGGGFLHKAAPATVTALILSDVIGNDLRMVASGPTVSPIGGASDARQVLQAAGIWGQMPVAVQQVLQRDEKTPDILPTATNHLIGSNEQSVAAMDAVAKGGIVHSEPLIGDVGDAAAIIASKGSGLHLFGGETTVRLRGAGLGGRNQELALRLALLAETAGWPAGWVFLSGGTDGRDGPTDAAGGVVDCRTLARMREAGVDPYVALANNDSYHALKASGDLLMTGATGTNVADLQVLIRP